MSCASLLFGSEFSAEDIEKARSGNGLLTMEVEVGTCCNFRCRYCYVGDCHANAANGRSELTADEIRDVISQGQALGARKIVLLGGEPMLYDFTPDLCEWIRGRGMGVEMFTNGTNMTAAMAERLFALGVHVVLKWHSADHQIQDFLAGASGAASTARIRCPSRRLPPSAHSPLTCSAPCGARRAARRRCTPASTLSIRPDTACACWRSSSSNRHSTFTSRRM